MKALATECHPLRGSESGLYSPFGTKTYNVFVWYEVEACLKPLLLYGQQHGIETPGRPHQDYASDTNSQNAFLWMHSSHLDMVRCLYKTTAVIWVTSSQSYTSDVSV